MKRSERRRSIDLIDQKIANWIAWIDLELVFNPNQRSSSSFWLKRKASLKRVNEKERNVETMLKSKQAKRKKCRLRVEIVEKEKVFGANANSSWNKNNVMSSVINFRPVAEFKVYDDTPWLIDLFYAKQDAWLDKRDGFDLKNGNKSERPTNKCPAD